MIMTAGFDIMLARLTETTGIENDPPIATKMLADIDKRVAAKK